jgi:hypothetical protein
MNRLTEDAVDARRLKIVAIATAAVLVAPCCGSDESTAPPYDPAIPAAWASSVTNPYFPLVPGTVHEYAGATASGVETIVVEVPGQTKVVNGVTATAVRDRAFLDGVLIEETEDWFAQDADGNVWYLGEATQEIENGQVVSTEGSWEWGVDGALPGIIMWADPGAHIGEEYQQEFYEGEAEDQGKVVAVNEAVSVPYGSFTGCIKTEDTTPLEPGVLEHKYYCSGVGQVLEVAVASGERLELVAVTGP